MNILICGDIVGRSGRDAIEKFLPSIIKQENIEFVIELYFFINTPL